jgi:transposase
LPNKQRRFRYPGRKPLDDRPALQGILFVLHTGIGWEHLPQELGFGCGMTAWRRLRAWQQAGVWERLHAVLLAELHAAGRLEWERAVAARVTCKRKRGRENGSQPGRPGSCGQTAPPPRRRPRAAARFAWLDNRRRLLIRTDRRDDIHEGFLALDCCLICWRRLETSLR